MERLLVVMTGLSIALIAWVLLSVRRSHIRVEYSVSWLAAALVLLLLSRWNAALDALAAHLGVENPTMALWLIASVIFLIVLFRFSIIISDLKDTNIALTQKIAILEYRVESLQRKHEEHEPTAT